MANELKAGVVTRLGRQLKNAVSYQPDQSQQSLKNVIAPTVILGVHSDLTTSTEVMTAINSEKLPDSSERYGLVTRGYSQIDGLVLTGYPRTDAVIMYDDIEATTLKWTKSDVAGVGTLSRDTDTVYSEAGSLKILTAGAGDNETAALRHFSLGNIDPTVHLKFSCTFYNETTAANDRIIFSFLNRNGTNVEEYNLAVVASAADTVNLQYQNQSGTYVNFKTGLKLKNDKWNYLEMEIDLAKKQLDRINIGGSNYQVNQKVKQSANTETHASLYLYVKTGAAATKHSFFDDVLVRYI